MRIDVLSSLGRHAVACALCTSLLTSPGSTPSAIAVDRPSLSTTSAVAATATEDSPLLEEVWALLDKYYLDRTFNGMDWRKAHEQLQASRPYTEDQALEAAKKLVSSLGDRYSRVLPPLQAAKLGKYDVTGVGINLIISDAGTMLVGAVPPEDSDAAREGVAFGDRVLSINGLSTAGMTSFDALEAIQTKGDVVRLRLIPAADVAKGQETTAREVALRRAFVTKDPVRYRAVESNGELHGYIQLTEFNARCKPRMKEALAALKAQGASSVVLDLRGNGGGVLDGAIGIAGMFVDQPLVLYVTDANGSKQPLYSREPQVTTLPLQIWVNSKTASSGEVLAGALHDNCRAKVIGERTYGKGVIQGVFGLSDGGALIETVASYATPSGSEINLKGIQPDESRVFVSDVLGSQFLTTDIKAATFEPPTCPKLTPIDAL